MAYQPSIQSYGNNSGMHYEGGFGGFGGKWVPNTNSAGRVGTSGGIGGFWDTGALTPIQQGTVGNSGMHYEGGFGGFGGKWVPNTNSASRVGASGGIGGFWDTRALPPIQQGTVGTTPPAWQATGGGLQYSPAPTYGRATPIATAPTSGNQGDQSLVKAFQDISGGTAGISGGGRFTLFQPRRLITVSTK